MILQRNRKYCKNKYCERGLNNSQKSLVLYPIGQKFCCNDCNRIFKNLSLFCQNCLCKKRIRSGTLKFCSLKCMFYVLHKNNSGRILTKKQKKVISESVKNSDKFQNNVRNENRSKLISNNNIKNAKNNSNYGMRGKFHKKDSRRKMRISRLNNIEKTGSITQIGKHETQLLDLQEKIDNCKIKRQFELRDLGYKVDGYCPETNTIYEVYERKHFQPKKIKKDLKRQKEIENYLNCNFIIIKDNL